MKKTLKQLANWLKIDSPLEEDIIVTGVSIDTRTIKQGDLFIPFRGAEVNGHRFVEQAFDKGAAASFWLNDEPNPPKNRPLLFVDDAEQALQQLAIYYRSEHKATFIGVTGSNGKTSVKDIIASVLSPYFKVQKTIGNYNNQLGLPLTILSLEEETQIAVLEMGMSGFGEIELLSRIARPHLALITNIGEAHMQDLGSRAGIAKAKYEITAGLLEEGFLIYDGDEPLLRELVAEDAYTKTKTFGFNEENDLFITAVTNTESGSLFTVDGMLSGRFDIPILGQHQVKNTLAAMIVCQALQLNKDQIRTSLAQIELTAMRMQIIQKEPLLFINDAYNAAPSSMHAALHFMEETTIRPEKWLVLGDMLELGENERLFHEELAQSIRVEHIDYVCLYGPRMRYLYEVLKGKYDETHLLYTEGDITNITAHIKHHATERAIILLKGSRGMKLETILTSF